jgi:myo-inositol-hexaphosphate 3-phosphohydrolase
VLLSTGDVQVMYRGELEQVVEPEYVRPGNAGAFVNGAATGYLYVAVQDGENSRVVAFDRRGGAAYQLLLPIGFTTGDVNVMEPFDGLQDVVVDEATGTLYIINDDAIWTGRYSLPPLEAAPSGTPPPDQ